MKTIHLYIPLICAVMAMSAGAQKPLPNPIPQPKKTFALPKAVKIISEKKDHWNLVRAVESVLDSNETSKKKVGLLLPLLSDHKALNDFICSKNRNGCPSDIFNACVNKLQNPNVIFEALLQQPFYKTPPKKEDDKKYSLYTDFLFSMQGIRKPSEKIRKTLLKVSKSTLFAEPLLNYVAFHGSDKELEDALLRLAKDKRKSARCKWSPKRLSSRRTRIQIFNYLCDTFVEFGYNLDIHPFIFSLKDHVEEGEHGYYILDDYSKVEPKQAIAFVSRLDGIIKAKDKILSKAQIQKGWTKTKFDEIVKLREFFEKLGESK